MPKQARQFAIKEIITDQTITNQEQLKRELRKKGFKVTQATLSRDLHELGVIRVAAQSGTRYTLEEQPSSINRRALSGNEIISISHNGSLVVIQTLPGHANSVAQYIDTERHRAILGTIAGDDTIFIAPCSTQSIDTLLSDLKRILIGG